MEEEIANKKLFKNQSNKIPEAKFVNHAGGKAYKTSSKHALAQIACTGCFNNTYYANGENQLNTISQLVSEVKPEFIAQVAIYSRKYGVMKDMPAYLLAYLCALEKDDKNISTLFKHTFFEVCDNMKMVRNFVQIIRSGAVGRKSFGTMPKRLIAEWLESKSDDAIFRSSIGNDPSLVDIIKLVHPKPNNDKRNALYGYFLGKEYNKDLLSGLIKHFEAFKKGESSDIPNVPFEMLTALPLSDKDWKSIAMRATWTQCRMNLNTFMRHNVFSDDECIKVIAEKLRNREEIIKSKVFPYQLMAAFINAECMPDKIIKALHDAMEISIENVPQVEGKVFVFPDVSGSMHSPVTGSRGSATTKMHCVHVAALVAAAFLRRNPGAEVIPFAEMPRKVHLEPNASVLKNAEKIFKSPGGGTNTSSVLKYLNAEKRDGDLLIYVSDNESFLDSPSTTSSGLWYMTKHNKGTETMTQWLFFRKRNPSAKLVNIDITPNTTSQTSPSKEILQIGGFSDTVFTIIDSFAKNKNDEDDYWVKVIEEQVKIVK